MKQTPLYAEHVALGARMGEFGGWAMPIQYQGILAEHAHTRTRSGLFDICHMGEFELSGPTARADLERLVTCNVESLSIGQCRYGFMLNEAGGVIDDLTCYRLDDSRYMVVVNASRCEADSAWIRQHLSPQTIFCDLSAGLAKLDVQGPRTQRALEEIFGVPIPALGYFHALPFPVLGCDLLLSRTGYTGEFGYELYVPVSDVVRIWRALLNHPDIAPVGLGARDTLRLEMGYSLYGHELSKERTPAAVSRGAFIRKKGGFIGEAALRRDLADPREVLAGLQFAGRRAARAGDPLFKADGGHAVGIVTSGAFAPSLGCAVALALLPVECSEPGSNIEAECRGQRLAAQVVTLPFYRYGTARQEAHS